MNLTGTTHSFELVTAAATEVVYGASWTDIDKTTGTVITPGSAQGSVSAAGTVTVVPAPASATIYRTITSFWAKATGGAQLVGAQKDVGGTNYPIAPGNLGVNESLHYNHKRGWYTLSADGVEKGVGATGAAGTDGGGTIIGTGTSVVDFGAFPGSSHASLVVTGEIAVVADSLVYCWLKPEATADHSADEHLVETIKVFASDVVAGVGFTLHALNTSERHEPDIPLESLLGRFSGTGAASGLGQAARNNPPNRGGKGTRIYGRWSVGWMYTQ